MQRLVLFVLLSVASTPVVAQATPDQPRVVPVYWVPADETVPLAHVALTIDAVADVRRWYGAQLGGRTFRAEPLIVQRSRHAFEELADSGFQAWWPLGQRELADYGIAWTDDDVKLLLVTRGAGAWAGSDSENGGIDSVAEAGVTRDGDLGGFAVIGDSSVAGYLAGVCPEAGREGGTAWWCSWATFRGTVAHELGHTWGLPHPDAFVEGYRCGEGREPTVLQCHWGYPEAGLLEYERRHLLSLRYFAPGASRSHRMLTDEAPAQGIGFRRVTLARDSTLTWLSGRGGGTGYPWAIVLTPRAGTEAAGRGSGRALARYELRDVVAFAAEVGVVTSARGESPSGGAGRYRVQIRNARGSVARDVTIVPGEPPLRLAAALDGGGLVLEVSRLEGDEQGDAVVFGNPRVWVE